jgi:hypothetical protein
MNKWTKTALAIMAFSGALSWTLIAKGEQATAPKPSTPEKTAGEAMKNVQVLKDIPASEWNNVMFFISGSLGVGCEHGDVNGVKVPFSIIGITTADRVQTKISEMKGQLADRSGQVRAALGSCGTGQIGH